MWNSVSLTVPRRHQPWPPTKSRILVSRACKLILFVMFCWYSKFIKRVQVGSSKKRFWLRREICRLQFMSKGTGFSKISPESSAFSLCGKASPEETWPVSYISTFILLSLQFCQKLDALLYNSSSACKAWIMASLPTPEWSTASTIGKTAEEFEISSCLPLSVIMAFLVLAVATALRCW